MLVFFDHSKWYASLAFLLLSQLLFAHQADALDKVSSPAVNKGEIEMEYGASTTFDDTSAKNNDQSHEFEVEVGITDRIALEMGIEFEREPGEELKSEAIEFGAKFQFTETGEYWVDSGIDLGYSHATHDDDADEISASLLLQKQWHKTVHLANLELKQEVGSHAEGGPERELLWSSRYLASRQFEPGFEIQSDFGRGHERKSFDEQKHYLGPALYGEFSPQIKYEAAYLFGVSDAASDGAARIHLEYEFFF